MYSYYCLHKLRILPHEFLDLGREEKCFVMACIDKRIEDEKEQAEKLK